MPSEVHLNVNLGLSKGQHRTVFRNPRGQKQYYAFYIDAFSDLVYEASISGMAWGGASGAVSGADTIESFDVKMRDDGSQLVVWVAFHTGTTTKYVRGTIADASSTISFGSVQTIDAAITDKLAGAHCIAVARTANARLVVAFTEDFTTKGKSYRLTKLIGSDGDGSAPTWSGETTLDDPSGSTNNQNKDQVWFGLESYSSGVLSGNGILGAARFPQAGSTTGYDVIARPTITWNGTTMAGGNVAQFVVDNSSNAKIISGLVDASDFSHVLYYDGINTRPDHRKSTTAGGSAYGGAITIKSADVDACSLALDTGPATDELYAFYHDVADTQDFHHKKTPVDTISWGAEQTITYAQDVTALTTWNRVIEGSLHIGGERV